MSPLVRPTYPSANLAEYTRIATPAKSESPLNPMAFNGLPCPSNKGKLRLASWSRMDYIDSLCTISSSYMEFLFGD